MVEEFSRQKSIQTVVWMVLDAFIQIYSNFKKKKKAEWKYFKSLPLGWKRSEKSYKNLAKEGVFAKRLAPIKRSQIFCIRTVEMMPEDI